MPDITEVLITTKVEGVYDELKHHEIAYKLKLMSDEWDEIELKTGVRPPEAYDYSFGLIMEKELFYAVSEKDKTIMAEKIESELSLLGEI